MVRLSLLVAAVVAYIGLTAPAARSAEQPELSGVYRCDGANPDGSPYRGVVEIAKNHDTFHVRWSFPDGRSAFGVGFVRSNSLSVSYFGGGVAGLAIYKIGDDEKLVGEWTVAGADGTVYTETLTKMSGDVHAPANRDNPHGTPGRRPVVKPTGPVVKS